MQIFLILSIILLSLTMFFMHIKWKRLHFIFNLIAVITMIVFGSIVSVSIYQIIRDNTIFMTNIHGIFLNPFFLVTGSYLGLYIIYQLLIITFKR